MRQRRFRSAVSGFHRVSQPPSDPGSGLGPYRRGIFPSGFVLGADSLDDMLGRVRRLGIEPRAPYEIARQLSDEPAVTMRYRFSVSVDGVACHFHADLDGSSWLSEVDMLIARDLPVALLAIEFAVSDLRLVETLLHSSGIGFRGWGARLLVEPRGGYGCGIAFTSTPA
jgi:hypothetical protein